MDAPYSADSDTDVDIERDLDDEEEEVEEEEHDQEVEDEDEDEDDGKEPQTIGQGEMVNTLADDIDTMVDDQPTVLPKQVQEMCEHTPRPQSPARAARPQSSETHPLSGREHLGLVTPQKPRPVVPTVRDPEAARNTPDAAVD